MKTKKLTTLFLKIVGMHCASCAINIDFEIEDLDGVKEAKTHYAKQESLVTFDPEKLTNKQIIETIAKLGYEAVVVEK
ncbi:hypothetical protein A2801_02630 [Candidatus Woesebacteria bacterium RIFCSPHIGHO2_01_FULL_41_10]|uniref:HMA domain-containing protein n=1 Tax=Candidatus Woesebacteria bacterium RIFCSPHIGHO2_01_FULL_41_10 TaxID=1802500 RepID=A0A1F7YM75_9BACT|nr:MAG: hypothetical protein A2801_02630 [Candidatus Woesebacteria bacterium RIFCSPHIGHO2_01_FULL_41_10]